MVFSPGRTATYTGNDLAGTGFTLVKDDRNGFWLGTWGSRVIELDSSLEKTGEYTLGDGGNIVEHICTGDSSDIWVALMGGGLGHLFPETGHTEIFTTSDGLANNITYSIIRDNNGLLWISTNQGISMFNPATRLFRNFGKAEGLLVEEFDSDSYFKSAGGELLFGGVGGVVSFHPDYDCCSSAT
jgi:streptogramin lyase